MVMKAMRDGASNFFVKNILFGLLMLAAIGLAFSGGNNFSRGGVAVSDVARIGNQTISLQSFDHNLRRSIGRAGINLTEAYKVGYIDQFLAGEVRSRIMDQAAQENGILVSRRSVAQQIRKMIEPMISKGQDPKQILQQILASQGMSEGELTDAIRRETEAGMLSAVVQGGFTRISDDLAHDLFLAQNEMRDVDYVIFPDSDVKDLPPPADADLQKLYEASKEGYAIPETRVLQLIKVRDDNLKKTLEITDEQLKAAYDSNKDSYFTPAQHTLDQALLLSEAEGKKIHDAVQGGKSIEQATKDDGQISAYLGASDVEDGKIQPELKDAVMASKEGDLIGPVKGALGWYVVKVKKISKESSKSFDSVQQELKDELYENKLVDQKYALANQVDDLLAGGTSVEDVAHQVDVEVTDLPVINAFGQGADGKDALKAYPKISGTILQTGFKLGDDETSAVSEMADGSFTAIHVKKLTPKSYKPFESVKEQIRNNWISDQAAAENSLRVAKFLADIQSGKKTLKDIAGANPIQSLASITRKYKVEKPLTDEAIGGIFNSTPGTPVMIKTDHGEGIALVKGARWPDQSATNTDEFKKFKDALTLDTRKEAIMVYMESKNRKYKAVVNNDLLAQAYGPKATDE